MKNKYLLLPLFLFATILVKAQIPNASFENWDTINNTCNSWYSLNDAFGFTNTSRENISVDGNYSIGLVSLSVPGFGIVPGLATTGVLNTLTNTVEGGYATNERPDSLIGFVKEDVLSGDTSSALVIVYHHGTTSQEIGRGGIYFTGVTTGFRRFSFPINYTSSLSTDTILIILSGGRLASVSAGSKITIDQLSYFPSSGTGINLPLQQEISVYQTPSDIVVEHAENNSQIQLLDINGRVVSKNEMNINTTNLMNGMYFLQITNSNYETYSKKLIIQH